MNPLGNNGARRRGSEAFYGDTGTVFTGPAREDIEKQESSGAGHPGNNVDISQRTAQSEADEYAEQAERITRSLERESSFKYSGLFSDPDKRRGFVEGLADQLRGKPAKPAQPSGEEQRTDDDEFMKNPEKWNEMRKKEKNVGN